MNITLLGTNGWFDTETGNTPCVLFQTDEVDIIFDAGYGFAKLDRYLDGQRPAYLLLSHFHLDHLVGLHTLPKNRFAQGRPSSASRAPPRPCAGCWAPPIPPRLTNIPSPFAFSS